MVYHIEALSVVIRTTSIEFQKFFPVFRKTGLKYLTFLFFSLIASENCDLVMFVIWKLIISKIILGS